MTSDFIVSPFRKVEGGKVQQKIEFLTADQEDDKIVAQANAVIDTKGNFTASAVKARSKGDFPILGPKELDYMDVSPSQIVVRRLP